MKEQWILNGRQADFTRIACELSVPPLAVKLMVNRGIEEKRYERFSKRKSFRAFRPISYEGYEKKHVIYF